MHAGTSLERNLTESGLLDAGLLDSDVRIGSEHQLMGTESPRDRHGSVLCQMSTSF